MISILICHCVVVSDWNLTQYLYNWILDLEIGIYISHYMTSIPSPQGGNGLRHVVPGHHTMVQMIVIRSPLFNLFLGLTSGGMREACGNVTWRHFVSVQMSEREAVTVSWQVKPSPIYQRLFRRVCVHSSASWEFIGFGILTHAL